MLLQLRHEKKDRLLWIDLICIDQGNIDEKAIQVERMKDIFGEAQTIIASLGPHSITGMNQEISTCRPKIRKGDLGLKEPLMRRTSPSRRQNELATSVIGQSKKL